MSKPEAGLNKEAPAAEEDRGEQVVNLMFGEPEEATQEAVEETAVEEPSEDDGLLDNPALAGFRDGEQLDNRKLAESYLSAQKKLGEHGTALGQVRQELENYKLLTSQQQLQLQQLQTQAAVPQPAVQAVDHNAEIERLYREGKPVEAARYAARIAAEEQARENEGLRVELAQLKADQQQHKTNVEVQAFKAAHVQDGLFHQNGEPKDTEMVGEMQRVLQDYPTMKYEDVLRLASAHLGRVPKTEAVQQPTRKPLPAKAGAVKSSPRAASAGGDQPKILGLSEEDAKKLFPELLSDDGWE